MCTLVAEATLSAVLARVPVADGKVNVALVVVLLPEVNLVYAVFVPYNSISTEALSAVLLAILLPNSNLVKPFASVVPVDSSLAVSVPSEYVTVTFTS